jgi:hypothetical protein
MPACHRGEQHRGERPDRSPGWSDSEAGLRSDAVATDEVWEATRSRASESPCRARAGSPNGPAIGEYWKDTRMPMRYGEQVLAGRGAMARAAKQQGRV